MILTLALACSDTFLTKGTDPVVDTAIDTSDADTDADSDADSDTDADTDADTDTDTTQDTGPFDRDGDGFVAADDCDDSDERVNPATPERWYDGVDQDCDGNDTDQDGDGHAAVAMGGDDCDDVDATVLPGGLELWYDGVDQDCDGNDSDMDLDGYDATVMGGPDCDDADAAIGPDAVEAWYDGVDQDCDGNDADQDGDGQDAEAMGGPDCDDTDARTYDGATEVWYDGVDEACDGGSDYDQDLDGELAVSGGGDDCDDTDATVNTGGAEVLDDGVDSDCDGDADSPVFTAIDTFGSSGTQGPRIDDMSGYVILTWMGDGMRYSGTNLTAAAGMQFLDDTDLRSGPVSDSYWEWGAGYAIEDGLDFYADDDHWIWAYGLRASGTRYLMADGYSLASSTWGNTVLSRTTSYGYDDVELIESDDGTLHIVGCDSSAGYLGWIHGDAGEITNTRAVGFEKSGVVTDTCGAFPQYDYLVASLRSSSTLAAYSANDTSGLAYVGTYSGWHAWDVETLLQDGEVLVAAAEGAYGVYVFKDPDEDTIAAAYAEQVDIAMDSTGRMYVLVADNGAAELYWGDPTSGFSSVVLDTTLSSVDDVDVHVTDTDEVVLAVRGGDDISFAVVTAP